MKGMTKRIGLAVAALGLWAGTAQADITLDLSGATPGTDLSTFEQSGYVIEWTGGGDAPRFAQLGADIVLRDSIPGFTNTSSGPLLLAAPFVIHRVDNAAFSLISLDIANLTGQTSIPGFDVRVTTDPSFNPANTQFFPTSSTTLQTVFPTGLSNVTAVYIAVSNYLSEDDLVATNFVVADAITAVPEPSSIVVGGLGALLGLGYSWRRRVRVAT